MFADLFENRKRQNPDNVEIGPNDLSIDLFRMVYRNNSLDLHVRLRAAAFAIPYECARLGISVVMNNGSDFATQLDRAIARSQDRKLIEAKPVTQLPETQTLQPQHQPQPVLPSVYNKMFSNRFRRRI